MSKYILHNKPIWREIARISENCKTSVYIVGGAVRDEIIGLECKDYDFLTIGPAGDFAEKASRHLGGGRVVEFTRFDSAFFIYDDGKLEFTGPRIQAEDEEAVLRGDLLGRDFTINSLAAKLTQEDELPVLDYFDGMEDYSRGLLRTPADPLKIIDDDPVRILRAFRFSAKLNLSLAPELWEAIKSSTPQLERASAERIGEEIWKILQLPQPSLALKAMYLSGAMNEVLPEIANLAGVEKRKGHNHKDILLHTFKVVDNVAKAGGDTITRLAALLHDVAKPLTKRFDPEDGFTFHGHEDLGARMGEKIARRLRYSGETAKLTEKLVKLHMRPVNLVSEEVTDSAIRRLMTQAGEDMERQLTLCRADITSGNPQKVSLYLANFELMMERMKEVDAKDKFRAFQSPVRGEEIMSICNILPGPAVGKIKSAIEAAILDGIIPNEYEPALKYLLENKDEWTKP